jgi:hypothetical protein
MKKISTLLLFLFVSVSMFSQSRALQFDGADDYVSIPARSGVLTGNAITFEAWVKPSAFNFVSTIVNRGNSSNYFLVYFMNDDMMMPMMPGNLSLNVFLYNGSASVQLFYPIDNSWINQWHHVAVAYDGSTLSLYVDGNLVSSTGFSGNIPVNADNIMLGNDPGYNFFNGTLDEVRVWNVARTGPQIQAAMNTEISATTANLVAYYQFNQGTMNGNNTAIATATDLVAGNNGTLTNFALTGTTSNFTLGYGSLFVLPLKDGSFAATRKAGEVLLTWKGVATENTARFEIEYSENGSDFKQIGTVQARTLLGESDYAFTHSKPSAQNFYRLKTVDANGKSNYSQTLSVRMNAGDVVLNLLQNPVSSQLAFQLTAPKGSVLLQLLDPTGRVVRQSQFASQGTAQTASLDVSQLSAGAYLVSVNGTSAWFTKK